LDWSLSGKLIASGSNDKIIKLLTFDEDLNVLILNSANKKAVWWVIKILFDLFASTSMKPHCFQVGAIAA
jgi:hypothetical protein